MFLIDYIIIFIMFISVSISLSRGFLKELVSSFFWFFNLYFFSKYYYFISFYIHSLQNIFFNNKILMLVIFFFYKKILNCFLEKIIRETYFSYLNIILGGLFGILRSLLVILFFLLIFKYFDNIGYSYYIKNSLFFNVTNQFFINF